MARSSLDDEQGLGCSARSASRLELLKVVERVIDGGLAAGAGGGEAGRMRKSEVRAFGHLGGRAIGQAAGRAEEVHQRVAARAFGAAGRLGAPVRAVHDAVFRGAYGTVPAFGETAGDAVGAFLAPRAGGSPMASSPAGAQVLATLDALVGDRLDEAGSPLALPMTLRNGSEDIVPDRGSLEEAFPGAASRLVVFVHGLAETDLSWIERDEEGRPWSYAHALQPHGWTGALMRYNTGRHIADNGRSLSSLIEDVVERWPVTVTDLALVGHSMGGLVIRSACADAVETGLRWPGLVRSCVYLGSPHHGATLEQGVNVLGGLLGHLIGARPVAALLRTRSAGIQDLRHGLITGGPLAGGVPLLETSRHHLVAAHLGTSNRHPAALVLGDLMVRPGSALGLGNRRTVALDPCERATFPATSHLGLLKDRRIGEALVAWLA